MGGESSVPVPVMPEPQFGVRTVFRPYADFETDYQGEDPASINVGLSPGGVALDPLAGTPGYDLRLPRALETPIGCRVVIWFPAFVFTNDGQGAFFPYIYRVGFRQRSMADYRRTRQPYHVPSVGPGVANTQVSPSARFPIPAAYSAVVYNQQEPAGFTTPAVQHLRIEEIAVYPVVAKYILVPGGAKASYQQGVTISGSAVTPAEMLPWWAVYETQAAGDELWIDVGRATSAGATWDFAAGQPDAAFSAFYGSGLSAFGGPFPDLGVHVFLGSAP